MQDFEKLGAFYLGKKYDMESRETLDETVLYDSKDLTTHAICVGRTGSGKTGLCLSLLEEAAIDGIPAIIIDPKGDLGNLLLTFPDFTPEEFRPWVDEGEATRKGMTADEFAAAQANLWKKGLGEWGQDGDRIRKFQESCDVSIYTPGSNAGLPLTVLKSFDAPGQAVINDSDAFRERIQSAASGLLTLLGIDADPIRSREHILVSNLLSHSWKNGENLDLPGLIRGIQAPPFEKVGFMEVDTFYPAKERFELSMTLNNLLASPGFAAWMEGEPLNIQRLMYTPEGKPRLSIVSIAHLSDEERMFFLTILLSEVLAWVRTQSGTSSLRALLYMDEVAGYLPPTKNPPTKPPIMTLLKQARAFGLGVVLATQNPVDVDYKALSNAGTWFLGRLQTERDKARVIEGLEGASAQAGASFDKAKMEQTLAGVGKRVFLMNNVHEDEAVIFHTRWAMSYLRGPLTRNQIQQLMADRKASAADTASPATATSSAPASATVAPAKEAAPEADSQEPQRPIVPPEISESFLPVKGSLSPSSRLVYRPMLLGTGKLHFVDSKTDVDVWEDVGLLSRIEKAVETEVWTDALSVDPRDLRMERDPEDEATFSPLPSEMTKSKSYSSWGKQLKDHFYRVHRLKLWECEELDQFSKPGESEGDFRVRLRQVAHEQRDLEVEKLRKKFAPKLASLQDKIQDAKQKVEKEKAQYSDRKMQTLINVGSSIIGALFGRKLASATNVGRASSAAKSFSYAARERTDVIQAEQDVEELVRDLEELEEEFQSEIESAQNRIDPATVELTQREIKPRKYDITLGQVALVWTPWSVDSTGIAEAAYG